MKNFNKPSKTEAQKKANEEFQKNKMRPYKPQHLWHNLVNKVLKPSKEQYEESYSRMRRSSISNIFQIGKGQAIAIRPGQVRIEPNSKSGICIVVDNAKPVVKQLQSITKKLFQKIKIEKYRLGTVWIIKYDKNFSVFKADSLKSQMTYQKVSEDSVVALPKMRSLKKIQVEPEKFSIEQIFQGEGSDYPTVYSEQLNNVITRIYNDNNKLIFFAGEEVTKESNLSCLRAIFKVVKQTPNSCVMIFDNNKTFNKMIHKRGGLSMRFYSHIK